MIEAVSQVLRWLHPLCGFLLVGTFSFLLLAGDNQQPLIRQWRKQLLGWASVLALALLVAGVMVLGAKAALASGKTEDWFSLPAWLQLLSKTQFGTVWMVQHSLVATLCLFLLLGRRFTSLGWRNTCITGLALAVPAVIAPAFAGHGAAAEYSVQAITSISLHLLGISIWAGAFLALGTLLFTVGRSEDPGLGAFLSHAFQRFSNFSALPGMAAIVASGIFTAYLQIGSFAALLGTYYGFLILLKIALLIPVLAIAIHIRHLLQPVFAAMHCRSTLALTMGRWLRAEAVIVLLIIGIASIAAEIPPAMHEQIVWRLPFRFSIDATWEQPYVQLRAIAGLGLALAGVVIALSYLYRSGAAAHLSTLFKERKIRFALLFILAGALAGLPPLAIEAYPDTYRRTDAPYEAVSIANGARLFATNCTACHGVGGKGDGPIAASTPKKPANLTEPHTALHTAGDMFWWLTHGMSGGMPGFADRLTVEERWDLINYLRAFSVGYQGRVVGHSIAPERPWLGAPDFNYAAHNGTAGTLKDFRSKKAILLVLFSPASAPSQARLAQLQKSYAGLAEEGVEVLAVPAVQIGETIEPATRLDDIPFPVVTQGYEEIVRTYRLLRRTTTYLGADDDQDTPPHMEFLIDRYGYVRARWVSGANSNGWAEADALTAQATQLKREKQILPYPDDHVH